MTDTETDGYQTHRERGSDADTETSVENVRTLVEEVVANVDEVIVGGHDQVEHVMIALLGQGHVLLEDVPGVGKTMLARAVARSFDGQFKRIQFTPDLLPSDVTGVNIYNERTEEFEFRPGPVFANVVLGDEINRAPPKTQSALLEAMEERQTTVDGETHALPDPFTVIATQNTIEGDRAYDLPMAELDRFTKRISLGYPGSEEEVDLLGRVVGDHPITELSPVATPAELRAARDVTANVVVAAEIREYVTRIASYTRDHAELGVSPRGSIHLLRAAQARAALDGREYVIPDDVQTEAHAVLPHRIRTASNDGESLVDEALERVAIE